MRIDLRIRDQARMYHRYRVLLGNEDVSNRCFLADDREHVVGLYLRDSTGHFYNDFATGEVAREFIHGHVTIIHPADSSDH